MKIEHLKAFLTELVHHQKPIIAAGINAVFGKQVALAVTIQETGAPVPLFSLLSDRFIIHSIPVSIIVLYILITVRKYDK